MEQTPQGDKVLGAVVLSFENQKDGTLSYWEISKRVGWQATVHNYLYEQVLEEPLEVALWNWLKLHSCTRLVLPGNRHVCRQKA